MADTPDQIRPLAAASDRPHSTDGDDEESSTSRFTRRRLRCCTIVAAILLLLAILILVLIFTVFRVKDPIIKMNNVTVAKFDLAAGVVTGGANLTLIADVSVKNPNYASFRYQNTTTTLYYRGSEIGEARGPGGRARARRTMRMNITVDVMAGRVLSDPELAADLTSGLVTMSSYTVVRGRVKLAVIRRHVTVKMNCSMTINVTSRAIQTQKCRRKVKL